MGSKRWTLVVLALAVALVAFYNLAILLRVTDLAGQGYWLEEKVSKGTGMARMRAVHGAGFVGTSRTQYNVAAALLDNPEISAINYGLPGRHWNEYLYAIDRLLGLGADVIVIGVTRPELTRGPRCPREFTFREYGIYRAAGFTFFRGCPLLSNALAMLLPAARFERFVKRLDPEHRRVQRHLRAAETRYGVHVNPDEVNFTRQGGRNVVVTLKNRDGIRFGDAVRRGSHAESLAKVHPRTLRYLTELEQWIRARGATLVLVIEPERYDIALAIGGQARATMGGITHMLDMTPYRFDPEDWADATHFNHVGRVKYTRALREQLLQLGIPALGKL